MGEAEKRWGGLKEGRKGMEGEGGRKKGGWGKKCYIDALRERKENKGMGKLLNRQNVVYYGGLTEGL